MAVPRTDAVEVPVKEGTDRRGHQFLEIPWSAHEALRITLVPEGWSGGRSVRLQARDASGRLRPGPEIPEHLVGDLIKGMVELVRK